MHNTINLDKVNVHLKANFKECLLMLNLKIKRIVGKGLSGKSTILKSIIGLTKISSGEIKINNMSTTEKKFNSVINSMGMVLKKMHYSMV